MPRQLNFVFSFALLVELSLPALALESFDTFEGIEPYDILYCIIAALAITTPITIAASWKWARKTHKPMPNPLIVVQFLAIALALVGIWMFLPLTILAMLIASMFTLIWIERSKPAAE